MQNRAVEDEEFDGQEVRLNNHQLMEVCWDAVLWARDGFGMQFDPQTLPMVIIPFYLEGEQIAINFSELVRNVVGYILASEQQQMSFSEAAEELAKFGFFKQYDILPPYAEAKMCEFLLRLCMNLLNWDSSEGIAVLERMTALARTWVPASCEVQPAEVSLYEPIRMEYDCGYHLSYSGETQ